MRSLRLVLSTFLLVLGLTAISVLCVSEFMSNTLMSRNIEWSYSSWYDTKIDYPSIPTWRAFPSSDIHFPENSSRVRIVDTYSDGSAPVMNAVFAFGGALLGMLLGHYLCWRLRLKWADDYAADQADKTGPEGGPYR